MQCGLSIEENHVPNAARITTCDRMARIVVEFESMICGVSRTRMGCRVARRYVRSLSGVLLELDVMNKDPNPIIR